LRSWRGDGVLARINDRRMAEAVLHAGVPAVDLRSALGDLGLPIIGIDNKVVVRMAVEYFLDRGFRHFAFCGTPPRQNRYQDERANRFGYLLAERGFACDFYLNPPGGGAVGWEEEQHHVADWLRQLPKPVALMACHDDRGHQVLDACQRAGILVPDEVAILGVDNDPFLCNLSIPPLSSIDVNPERIGYEAASVLDRMMDGRRPPRAPIYTAPRGIVTRQSTDVLAVSDPYVAHAARQIRDHACSLASIEELLHDIPISRTTLFRRFKQHLGRSPKEEMTRIRLARAKELLSETDLPIRVVSERVGYAEAKYFSQVFHEAEGVTPLRFRKEASSGDRGRSRAPRKTD
jgi:LacI family transcriptional regulator